MKLLPGRVFGMTGTVPRSMRTHRSPPLSTSGVGSETPAPRNGLKSQSDTNAAEMTGYYLEGKGRPRDNVDFPVQPAREQPIACTRRTFCARPAGSWATAVRSLTLP
jgi:hypothetical protein